MTVAGSRPSSPGAATVSTTGPASLSVPSRMWLDSMISFGSGSVPWKCVLRTGAVRQGRHLDSLASAGEWVERGFVGVMSRTRMVWSSLLQMKMRGSSAAEKCYPNINSTILSRMTSRFREDHSEGRFGGQNAASEG
jgi:hypothetical protein